MNVNELDYSISAELIAREPREFYGYRRSDSRLLVMDKSNNTISHRIFHDIIEYFNEGDVLVLNNSKTIKARLQCIYNKVHVVNVDVFGMNSEGLWNCYIFPDSNCRPNGVIEYSDQLTGRIIKKTTHNLWQVEFYQNDIMEILNQIGKPIISHYIKKDIDISYMQNVYANVYGSSELPAAGRHFDQELLKKIQDKGVKIVYITLHTGMSSIWVETNRFEEHTMHEEYIELNTKACNIIQAAKKDGKKIFATGTTVMRTLETCGINGNLQPYTGFTSLYIYPGFKFNIVDAFITNFHGPRTSRIALAAAFTGKELLLKGYKAAIEKKYMFYEFGDATLTIGGHV